MNELTIELLDRTIKEIEETHPEWSIFEMPPGQKEAIDNLINFIEKKQNGN